MLVVMEFLLATAFISAFMDNVTTVILMAPVTILITQLLRLPTVPILIMEAIFSNIGGTATLIGDPPNILIGASCNLSFNDFLINLTPVVLIVMAVTLGVVLLQMRKNLRTGAERRGAGPPDRAEACDSRTGPALPLDVGVRLRPARLFHQPPDRT